MLYRMTIKDCKNDLLVSAEDIECALGLIEDCGWKKFAVRKIEHFNDIKTILDMCWETPEEQLEALINAVTGILNADVQGDLAAEIAFDATGVSGMVNEIIPKEG